MAGDAETGEEFEIRCPHCKKAFTAQLIAGSAERYRGFKCPHCKLFVPESRVDDEPAAEAEPS
jgi:phage FluMu protein Com